MEERVIPTETEHRVEVAHYDITRRDALRGQITFAHEVAEHIRNNQEDIVQGFNERLRERFKPLEILLGVDGSAEIFAALADIKELRPHFYLLYRSTMEDAAVIDIRKVFGDNSVNLYDKNSVSRLVTAWEYWKKQPDNTGKSFREFLELRKEQKRDNTGPLKVEDIIGDAPTYPYNEKYAEKNYEREGRDVIEDIVDSTDFAAIITLAEKGSLLQANKIQLQSFKEIYIKKLPENKKFVFSKIWDGLTSTGSLKWYGKERMAYLLGVNSVDVKVVDDRTVMVEKRGERQKATITLRYNGGYSVISGNETRDFSDQQMQEMVRFLHRASV